MVVLFSVTKVAVPSLCVLFPICSRSFTLVICQEEAIPWQMPLSPPNGTVHLPKEDTV